MSKVEFKLSACIEAGKDWMDKSFDRAPSSWENGAVAFFGSVFDGKVKLELVQTKEVAKSAKSYKHYFLATVHALLGAYWRAENQDKTIIQFLESLATIVNNGFVVSVE